MSVPNIFLCAVDGSAASDMAFKTSISLLKESDHLCVFHGYSPKKDEYLPANLKSSALKENCDAALSGRFPRNRADHYTLYWRDREDQPVQHLLTDISNSVEPDFLIVGYRGRKCVDISAPASWGSNVNFTIRHIESSCIIAKHSLEEGPRKFVYAVKNNTLCKEGLYKLLRLVTIQDQLIILFIGDDEDEVREMKAFYEREMEGNCSPESCFRNVEACFQESVLDTIADLEPDFCCLAPRVKDFANTVTEKIIKSLPCSMIILKPLC